MIVYGGYDPLVGRKTLIDCWAGTRKLTRAWIGTAVVNGDRVLRPRTDHHSRLSSPVRAATTAVVSTQPARIDAHVHQRASPCGIQWAC
jgi:hypothetical protein